MVAWVGVDRALVFRARAGLDVSGAGAVGVATWTASPFLAGTHRPSDSTISGLPALIHPEHGRTAWLSHSTNERWQYGHFAITTSALLTLLTLL